MRRYGDLVRRTVVSAFPRLANWATDNPVPARDRKIRVGVVCAFVRNHAGWRNRRGWFHGLDSDTFDLYLYDLSKLANDLTMITSYAAFDYVRDMKSSVSENGHIIARDNLDVIIFPELGMSRQVYYLGAMRLAPVQCVSFGHPETTGLPTIDYMLSSDFMEPENAQDHYTEELVRLPGTGFYRYPTHDRIEHTTRADHGLSEDDIVFFYGHNVMKMLPDDDAYLAEIASLSPKVVICIIDTYGKDKEKLKDRMRPEFERHGIDIETRVRFFSKMKSRDFLGLISISDVYLDCPSWNGNNVAVDAFRCGLPPVVVQGSMLRSRHCYGLLKRMELSDLVCTTKQQAVEFAQRLVEDRDFYKDCVRRVQEGYPRLFWEHTCIEELNRWLKQVVGRA